LLDDFDANTYDSYKEMSQDKNKNHIDLQKQMLQYNDEKNDPFRCISIGDAVFPDKDTQLVGLLKIVSCDRNKEVLITDNRQIQAETIRGELLDGAAFADTAITIDTDLQKISLIKKLSVKEIIDACNIFYWSEFKEEYERFYKNILDGSTNSIDKLRKKLEIAAEEKNQFIIRVGRWSQVEFVTLREGFRRPYTKRAGTTRTVFNYKGQFVPMGWCLMTVKEMV
jgi:CRISPR-associated protein Csm5